MITTFLAIVGEQIDVAKILVGAGAGGGTFAFFAWMFYKNYAHRVDSDITYLKTQIEARAIECSALRDDNKNLHREIRDMQKGIISKAIDAMTANENAMIANTEALQRLFQKLGKKD